MLNPRWENVFEKSDIFEWRIVMDSSPNSSVSKYLHKLLNKYARTQSGGYLNLERFSWMQKRQILNRAMEELEKAMAYKEIQKGEDWEARQKSEESEETRLQRQEDLREASIKTALLSAEDVAMWVNAKHGTIKKWKSVGSSEEQFHEYHLPKEVKRAAEENDSQTLFEIANDMGWISVGYSKGHELTIDSDNDQITQDILEILDQKLYKFTIGIQRVVNKNEGVPVLQGEDAMKAWKERNDPRKLYASVDKISSRDAVDDTINYWKDTKNKDFIKYWRKLRKDKKRKKR